MIWQDPILTMCWEIMSKNFNFLQFFGRLNELVSQNERKTQQIFLPKSNIFTNTILLINT